MPSKNYDCKLRMPFRIYSTFHSRSCYFAIYSEDSFLIIGLTNDHDLFLPALVSSFFECDLQMQT